MKTVLCTALLLMMVRLACSAAALTPQQVRQIDRIATNALGKQHISGMEIGVGRAGTVLYSRGYGLRDRADRLPVTAHTIFPVGSITKQFTATSVMILAGRGGVNLDAMVSRYLPNAPHGNEITVRQLLDQTSGLPDYLDNKPLLAAIMAGTDRSHSMSSLVALVNGKPLHFKPGSKWEYSNTNYALAGMIVSRVSGVPYPQFLQHEIFAPQHLDSTQYLRMSVPSGTDVTRGYNYVKGRFRVIPNFSMDWGNAAGAIASNVQDLIRWDNAYFSGAIIPLAAVRIATTPPAGVVVLHSKDRANNMGLGYAFGWVQARAEGRQMVWHNGGLPGARAMNATFPKDALEIIVLTNATDASPEDTALRIARTIYDVKRR
ncbi:MAG TPA: serine hydrolase domain-containing protein [Candidatus Baltobacteraceae bacterium]|jgi:CubicO group peptidase (beta-lactamase class C family)|nr:serine hydrolase domain-containing protein [Candidatus Baltobacteraceae bacterium]